MQIVIEIPDEIYNTGVDLVNYFGCYSDKLNKIIYGSTPLPKGHGRLIDENDLKNLYGLDDRLWWGNAVKEFTDLPTILEADKESTE